MSSDPGGPLRESGSSPARRLKLVMPSAEDQQLSTPSSGYRPESSAKETSGSPARPSYSPVTPTFSQPSLALDAGNSSELPQTQWIDEPDQAPVSLDENSDAMAVRAAISILQMQRQQTLRDMKILETMKQAALQDPEAFVGDLSSGKLNAEQRTGLEMDTDDDVAPSQSSATQEISSKFGKLPGPQNVVRAPPIEWAKYHVAGEPLDKMHEVQRHYPGWTEDMFDAAEQPQPQAVAAPYRVFSDKLQDLQTPTRQEDN